MAKYNLSSRDFSEPVPKIAPLALWDAAREGKDFDTAAHEYTVEKLLHYLSLDSYTTSEAANSTSDIRPQNFAQAISKVASFRIVNREAYDALPAIRRSQMTEKLAKGAFISAYASLDTQPENPPEWYTYWEQALINTSR